MPCCKKQRCDPLLNNSSIGTMKVIVMKDDEEQDEEDSSITSTVPVVVTKECCTIHVDPLDLDDEASLSSCEESNNKTTTPRGRERRTVHFDESQNKIHHVVLDTTQCYHGDDEYINKNDVWYNAFDYQQFKMTTTHIASKIAQAAYNDDDPQHCNDAFARTYYKVLQRTYEACCESAIDNDSDSDHDDTDTTDIDNDNKSNSNNNIFASATERAYIQQWIHAANSSSGALLGVAEKHAIYNVVLDRSHRRMELISAVLEIQDFCTRHQQEAMKDCDGRAAVAEMMRLASCEWSRPSRLFAQVLAQAVL
jgi:hypothetical protein